METLPSREEIIKEGKAELRVQRKGSMFQRVVFTVKKVTTPYGVYPMLFTDRFIDLAELVRLAEQMKLPVQSPSGTAFPKRTTGKDFVGLIKGETLGKGEPVSNGIARKGHAKVNLFLNVHRAKPGEKFHLIETVFQMLELHDEISVSRQGTGIAIESSDPAVPTDSRNTLYKTTQVFAELFGIDLSVQGNGVRISIKKGIPIAGGLGGSSSCVGPMLLSLADLFKPEGAPVKDLKRIAEKIGADATVSLISHLDSGGGGTHYATGFGQNMEISADLPSKPVVITVPNEYYPADKKTGHLYSQIDVSDYVFLDDGKVKEMKANLATNDWKSIATIQHNSFETVAFRDWPNLRAIKQFMLENGAMFSLLAGSGGTVFAIFETEKDAQQLKERLLDKKDVLQIKEVILTKTI
jgi:4-diphosphocytidyl-2-C-methyl-D-erythritol kinase